jgi:hypothetical protein
MKSTEDDSVAEAKTGMGDRKTTHHTCREAEQSAYNEKESSCNLMVSESETTCEAAPSCNCDSKLQCDDAESVLACADEMSQWVESDGAKNLKALKSDCDAKNITLRSTAETCDTDQSNYELAFCMYAKKLDAMCTTLETCYSDAIAAYNSTEKLVRVQEEDMQVMMASAKKIVCYFVVIKKGSSGNVSMKDYDVCKDLSVSTDRTYLSSTVEDLNITYPSVDDKATCDTDTISNTPGDSQWATTEYNQYTQDWLRETVVCSHKKTTSTTTTTTGATCHIMGYSKGKGYSHGDIGGHVSGVASASACQVLCQQDSDCGVFMYASSSVTCWKKCSLGVNCASSINGATVAADLPSGFTAGPKFCQATQR